MTGDRERMTAQLRQRLYPYQDGDPSLDFDDLLHEVTRLVFDILEVPRAAGDGGKFTLRGRLEQLRIRGWRS